MQLVDGVHALPLEYEFEHREMAIHPAAVETARGVILVDTGLPDSLERIEGALGAADYSLKDVAFVLLTHQDGDHVGGCRELLAATDATTLAHREATPYVEGDRAPVKGDPEDRPPSVPVDVQVVDGVRIRTLAGPMDVVFTPGHAPGHVALHFPDAGLLLAADALTAEEGRLQGPSREFTPDVEAARESVSRLSELAVESVLCYHGGHVEAGSDRIAEIYREMEG